jgi:hypothetical protein
MTSGAGRLRIGCSLHLFQIDGNRADEKGAINEPCMPRLPIINPSVISLRATADGGTNMPSKVWMSDFDKGSNDVSTVERTAGARGYLANNDRPTHKIRQERSRWARCNRLSVILLATCRRPNAAVLGQGHHK